ncbi:hypothetical protein KUV50_00105 [Membranicola marinus]|uniref:Uncharacterized protein n=1 Tax=Membranihabitans marinus TaxID=1227546 RepID=A0A953HQG3_9BACT|nr:hypothetical protein [Membranihabitans marinus]MBY5956515.1 hypothetical protein [Membranihabitans marinus]
MPANKKHLTKSPFERFLKISAGLVGGYMITEGLHIALAMWTHIGNVLVTLRYAGFILWAGLLIVALIARKGWKIWLLYLAIFILLCGIIYTGKIVHPIE